MRDPDELGTPKRGAVRLALETGAPLIPAAITGTEKLFAGPMPRPRTVRVAFGEPVEVEEVPATPEAAAELLDDELWPKVSDEFSRLRAHPGLIAAGLAAAGIGAGVAVKRRRDQRASPGGDASGAAQVVPGTSTRRSRTVSKLLGAWHRA